MERRLIQAIAVMIALLMGSAAVAQQQPVRTPLWAHGAPGFEDRAGIPELTGDYWTKRVNNRPSRDRRVRRALSPVPRGGLALHARGCARRCRARGAQRACPRGRLRDRPAPDRHLGLFGGGRAGADDDAQPAGAATGNARYDRRALRAARFRDPPNRRRCCSARRMTMRAARRRRSICSGRIVARGRRRKSIFMRRAGTRSISARIRRSSASSIGRKRCSTGCRIAACSGGPRRCSRRNSRRGALDTAACICRGGDGPRGPNAARALCKESLHD